MDKPFAENVKKMRGFYAGTPGAPIYQAEFGYYCLDLWRSQGHIGPDTDLDRLFGFDAPARHRLGQLGWCEAPFRPLFEEALLEDRGAHELVRDRAGRSLLVFKGRRSGFMPEYVDHPVKDMASWQRDVKWRLDPADPARYETLEARMAKAQALARQGHLIIQDLVGGYMYLRSLIGPVELLYAFYDDPALIHDCMRAWLAVADAVTAKHQEYVTLDEVFMAEDICYNHGPLISPDMIREFLFPYYRQLLTNIKKRQKDPARTLHIQIDTDGNAATVIDLYREIGMDYMSPFEVASGSDVVAIRRQYPGLLLSGGIDKRILAAGTDAIDRELERIMPFMRRQGGYLPTCDHGVPEEVSFENYMHYRSRMLEYGG